MFRICAYMPKFVWTAFLYKFTPCSWPQRFENRCIFPVHIPHKAANRAREKNVAACARPPRIRSAPSRIGAESCGAGRCIRARKPLRPPPPNLVRNSNSTRDLNGSTSNTTPNIPAACCAAPIPNPARTAKPKCWATSLAAKMYS